MGDAYYSGVPPIRSDATTTAHWLRRRRVDDTTTGHWLPVRQFDDGPLVRLFFPFLMIGWPSGKVNTVQAQPYRWGKLCKDLSVNIDHVDYARKKIQSRKNDIDYS